ncbi:MAG TPA: VOC family protein [Dongiaceae bacterium]|nr:VOC family protein [Dongiaceae bacterium]
MGRVVHFEIPAGDTDRVAGFYSKVFGWKFEKWPGPMEYWLVSTGDCGAAGINGGMLRKNDMIRGTTNTVQVDSVEESLAAIKAAGGKGLTPKTAIPGVGYFAYCEDTEGNVFGVMQNDTAAA